tara:strand:+ start:637 stop:1566 length:930 start_codon:yes stop_codon:yes gene_type:complete
MPYMGNTTRKASDIRRFDVTSSTSATHTLTWIAPNEQSLIVTINGVKQHEDSYSTSGAVLTLTSALIATDKLEVIGINDIGTTITPAQNSVDTDKLSSSVNAEIAANTAKVTNATHTGDVTGATALTIAADAVDIAMLSATGTADATTFLRGDNAWAAAGSDNTPAFQAHRSSGQGILDATFTLIAFNSETYDSNSAYDTGTGRFTVPSGEGGKYFVYAAMVIYSNLGGNDVNTSQMLIKKNGSNGAVAEWENLYGDKLTLNIHTVLDLSASDYLEVFAYMDSYAGSNCTVAGDAYPRSYFGAYKLIGV